MNGRIPFCRFLATGMRWLARLELTAVSLMLAMALSMSAYSIVARNLGYSTADWLLTLPEILLVWMTFLGCGALVTRNEHVAADFLLILLPRRVRVAAGLAMLGLAAAALVPVVLGSTTIVIQMWKVGVRNSELLDLPQALFYAAIPVGLGLTVVHIFGRMAELILAGDDHDANS